MQEHLLISLQFIGCLYCCYELVRALNADPETLPLRTVEEELTSRTWY